MRIAQYAVAVAIACGATGAAAAPMFTTPQIFNYSGNASVLMPGAFTVNPFNTTLGTLTGVEATIAATLSGTIALQNTSPTRDVKFNFDLSFGFIDVTSTTLNNTFSAQGVFNALSLTNIYLAPRGSGMTPAIGSNTIVSVPPGNNAMFTISGLALPPVSDWTSSPITLKLDGNFFTNTSAGGGVMMTPSINTDLTLQIRYKYDPANPIPEPVPEPATLALFGMGLLGLGLARNRTAGTGLSLSGARRREPDAG